MTDYRELVISYCVVCYWIGLWELASLHQAGQHDCPWCEARDSLLQQG